MHVLTIEIIDDDRHTRFVGACSCGWEFRDSAVIGYNDDSVVPGIMTRHLAHVEEVSLNGGNMNDEVRVRISETAAAILQVQNRRWWQFWKPNISQDRMEQIIRNALVGDHEPVAIVGVRLPSDEAR